MTNKFDALSYGEIPKSWINEPVVDFEVNCAVEPLSALEIARQRWQHAELISSERSDHE